MHNKSYIKLSETCLRYLEKEKIQYFTPCKNKESIDRYVLARLNSLNIPIDKGYELNYKKFSDEYFNANKYELIDPIGIDIIKNTKNKYDEWCKKVDNKLFEVNMFIEIWIDLLSTDKIWGINKDIMLNRFKEIGAKFETGAEEQGIQE